ncbi:MAG TPA: hypothetical protein VG937_09340 [Polyangiaceae bacterium]|nr:hypothetical protein [Polyangiaceae bacterium]
MKRSRSHAAAPESAGFRLILGLLRGLLLVALGVGYLVPALHFGLVQHELCAEHGELRHSGGHAVVSARPSAHPVAAADSVPEFADEHDHCAVVATSSKVAATVPSSASTSTLAAEASPSSLSRAELAHVSLALLHYAPKLAPPG